MYPSICPESVAWSHGPLKGTDSANERPVLVSSANQRAVDRIWAMSVWWTQRRQTWLQAIYKCPLSLVSGCIHTLLLIGQFLSFCPLIGWGDAWLACDTIADMTPMIQESNWYILSWESLGTILFTHRQWDKELTSSRNINWSLLNVRGDF